jgi:hypothetical protein
MNDVAREWAQTAFSIKPLVGNYNNNNKEGRIFRLGEKLNEAKCNEWMYMLRESNNSNAFTQYTAAFKLYEEGAFPEALSAIQSYLEHTNSGDNDALRLMHSIHERQQHQLSTTATATRTATIAASSRAEDIRVEI